MNVSSSVLLARIQARSRLRQWQLIQEISALGNLQRAANQVGMSQPAATHALGELEQLLGFSLFERHAKGMRPTPAGEVLLPKVRAAMSAFAESAEALSDLLAGSVGALRVGAIGAAVGGPLGVAIAEFTRTHPAVAVNVEQQPPEQLLLHLHEGFLDVVVSRKPPQLPADTVFERLTSDRYVIVCSLRHPLAGRTGLNREQLAQQLWFAPPKATIAERDFHLMWEGVSPPRHRCWVESRSLTLMWMMAEQRQALAMIPYNTVRPWLVSGVLAQIPGDWGPPLDPIGALYSTEVLRGGDLLAEFLRVLRRCGEAAPDAAAP